MRMERRRGKEMRRYLVWRGARFGTSRKPGGAFEHLSFNLIRLVPFSKILLSNGVNAAAYVATWYILPGFLPLLSAKGNTQGRDQGPHPYPTLSANYGSLILDFIARPRTMLSRAQMNHAQSHLALN